MRKSTLCVLTALTLSTCAIAHAETGAVQITGHKFKTAENCERQAPVGKFDQRCDVPAAGWRGAEGIWLPNVSQGAG